MTNSDATTLPNFIEKNNSTEFEIKYFYENEKPIEFSNIPKTTDTEIHWHFAKYISDIKTHSLQPFYVAKGNNLKLKVLNNDGSCALSNCEGTLFEDVSTNYKFDDFEFTETRYIDGVSALLSVDSGSNYFHWMCHVLPKIHLLNETEKNWDYLNKVVIQQNTSFFVEETLNILKVPCDKVLRSKKSDHYIFEKLIVPCRPNRHVHLSRWSLQFLKNTFLKNIQKKTRKLFVSRKKSIGRGIENKDELLNFLKPLGFEEVFMEEYSVQEQAKIFNGATDVISAHGAALTNLLFCDAGTRVIEIFSPNYVHPLYWNFCNILDLNYSYLIGDGERPPKNTDPHIKDESIKVDINNLKRLI